MHLLNKYWIALGLTISIACSPGSTARAQSSDSTNPPKHVQVYKVNPWITGSIIVVGLGSGLITPALNKDTISNAELASAQANPDNVPSFDRASLHQDITLVPTYDNYCTYLQDATILLPLTLLADGRVRDEWVHVLAIGLEVNAVVLSIYTISPLGPLFNTRYRPLVYYTPAQAKSVGIYQENGSNKNSFYSGHVASASAGCFFVAKVLSDFHPELGNDKYWLYAGAAVPSLAMAYFRFKTLDHFPSDIAVGMAVGTACGILIPELHRIGGKDVSMGVYTSPEKGTGLTISWTPKERSEP